MGSVRPFQNSLARFRRPYFRLWHRPHRRVGRAEVELRNYPRTAVMLMWDFGLRYPDAGIGAADTSTTRRPVGSGPSSWCPSSRNAPAARGTSTATRTSAPPPNDVACDPSIG